MGVAFLPEEAFVVEACCVFWMCWHKVNVFRIYSASLRQSLRFAPSVAPLRSVSRSARVVIRDSKFYSSY